MRSFRAPLAVFCMTVAAHGLWGQAPPPLQAPSPYPAAAVLSNQTDVYSGPGATFYPTNRLRAGDRIVILGESKKQPGWLEIVPPQGSYSWIDAKYVKTVPGVEKIGVVDTGDPKITAPILPGNLVNKEPNVEITRVATGTQLFLIDRATSAGGATYYPIVPVATEVRFVPLDAVRGGGVYAGNTGYGAPTLPTGGWQSSAGPATTPTGGWQQNTPAAVQPTTFVQYAQQGDQMLAAGNPERARLLYLEALGGLNNDPAWRTYLTGQLARISQGAAPGGQNPFQTASSPAGALTPAGGPPTAPPPSAPPGKQWSPWGVLRSTTFQTREGQPMYLLENRQTGAVLMYVTTNAGTSLRDYLGQTICVYGAVSLRNDDYIRNTLITAEQVATPPAGSK